MDYNEQMLHRVTWRGAPDPSEEKTSGRNDPVQRPETQDCRFALDRQKGGRLSLGVGGKWAETRRVEAWERSWAVGRIT